MNPQWDNPGWPWGPTGRSLSSPAVPTPALGLSQTPSHVREGPMASAPPVPAAWPLWRPKPGSKTWPCLIISVPQDHCASSTSGHTCPAATLPHRNWETHTGHSFGALAKFWSNISLKHFLPVQGRASLNPDWTVLLTLWYLIATICFHVLSAWDHMLMTHLPYL